MKIIIFSNNKSSLEMMKYLNVNIKANSIIMKYYKISTSIENSSYIKDILEREVKKILNKFRYNNEILVLSFIIPLLNEKSSNNKGNLTLHELSGKSIKIYRGLYIINLSNNKTYVRVSSAKVIFKDFNEELLTLLSQLEKIDILNNLSLFSHLNIILGLTKRIEGSLSVILNIPIDIIIEKLSEWNLLVKLYASIK